MYPVVTHLSTLKRTNVWKIDNIEGSTHSCEMSPTAINFARTDRWANIRTRKKQAVYCPNIIDFCMSVKFDNIQESIHSQSRDPSNGHIFAWTYRWINTDKQKQTIHSSVWLLFVCLLKSIILKNRPNCSYEISPTVINFARTDKRMNIQTRKNRQCIPPILSIFACVEKYYKIIFKNRSTVSRSPQRPSILRGCIDGWTHGGSKTRNVSLSISDFCMHM